MPKTGRMSSLTSKHSNNTSRPESCLSVFASEAKQSSNTWERPSRLDRHGGQGPPRDDGGKAEAYGDWFRTLRRGKNAPTLRLYKA